MRPIDADALKELFERYLAAPHVNDRRSSLSYGIKMGVEGCISYLNNAPTLDVDPMVHGRWEKWNGDNRHHCTACECYANEERDAYGYITSEFLDNYCPNCGARMDKE